MSVIGVDAGTSRVKAVRFDATWRAVDAQVEPTDVLVGPDGRREQDMRAVWGATARVLSAVARRAPDPIDFVAVTAQGDGCWLVDRAGAPAGPALLWNDNRTAMIVSDWVDDGTLEKAFRISGCYGAPGLASAQLRWLAEHEASTPARATRLLSCGSWLFQQLTGRQVLDSSEAANPFSDAYTRGYDPKLLELFGIADLGRLLPPIVDGADRVAPLRPGADVDLGLRPRTPVVLAPYDVVATAVGAGAVEPGRAFGVLGTTLCVGVVSGDPDLTRPPNGMTLPLPASKLWLKAAATLAGTEVLDWLAGVIGVPDAAAVTVLAAQSTHPSVPLLLLYLSPAGERSPFLDPAARGSLHGLDFGHTRADLARAAVDGLSLAVRDCVQATGRADTITEIALSGGGARSEVWRQTISDATGLPVVAPDVDEVGARGAVLSAAVDLCRFDDLASALHSVKTPGRIMTPRPAESARLDAAYDRFRTTRSQQAHRRADH